MTIPGKPHPQGRPRTRVVHAGARSFANVYDPPESRAWKKRARELMVSAVERARLDWPSSHPFHVRMLCVTALPDSEHRVRQPVPRQLNVRRGSDPDNLAKAVLDAANGVIFDDDAQVALIEVLTIIGAQGEPARTVVEARELEPWDVGLFPETARPLRLGL